MRQVESLKMLPLHSGPPHAYWRETQRPFCNLVFLLPLLLVYEFGIGAVGSSPGASIRNGADAWMRLWLHQAGIELVWLCVLIADVLEIRNG